MENIDALQEVYDILMHMSKKNLKKIPKYFLNYIDENRNKELIINIDYTEDISEQILYETKVILASLYSNYLKK